jgi:hypothetical protein
VQTNPQLLPFVEGATAKNGPKHGTNEVAEEPKRDDFDVLSRIELDLINQPPNHQPFFACVRAPVRARACCEQV